MLLSGILLAAGMSCLVVAFARSTPRLDAALERIGADGTNHMPSPDIGPVRSRSERLADSSRSTHPADQRAASSTAAAGQTDRGVLCRQGRDGDHRAVLPGLAGGAFAYLTGHLSPIPAIAVAVGGVIGFFVPDLLLRRATSSVWTGAAEALLVYIDLVTLERLTNAQPPRHCTTQLL